MARQFLRTRPKNLQEMQPVAQYSRWGRQHCGSSQISTYLTPSASLSRIGDKDLSHEGPHCKEFARVGRLGDVPGNTQSFQSQTVRGRDE